MVLTPKRVCGNVLLAIVYIASAEVALQVHRIDEIASLSWFPAGIALASLLTWGLWLCPGVAIGAFATIVANGHPAALAAWLAATDVLEVVVAVTAIRALRWFRLSLDSVRDVLALVIIALVVSIAGASVAVSGVFAAGLPHVASFWLLWSTWWWGHLSAYLVVAPALFALRSRPRTAPRDEARSPYEAVFLAVALLVMDFLIIERWFSHWIPAWHAPFLLVPLLMWAALRFGPRGAAIANLVANLLLLFNTSFATDSHREIADLQSFIIVSAVTTLLVGALAVEKWRALSRAVAILDSALDAIITVDVEDHVLELNPAAERLFGYPARSAVGRDLGALIVGPEDLRRYRENLRAVAAEDQPREATRIRVSAQRADGGRIPIEISSTRMPVEAGYLVTSFIRDVSQEAATELARRESHELLEARVVDRTHALTGAHQALARRETLLKEAEGLAQLGSFELDLETRELTWSDEMFHICGRSPKLGPPAFSQFLDSFAELDRPRVSATLERSIELAAGFDLSASIVRPDASICIVQARGVTHSANGRAHRIVACCQDITQRTAATTALRHFADIIRSSQDAIIGIDRHARIESWNPAAARIFGYAEAEVVGRATSMLVASGEEGRLDYMIDALRSGRELAHYELLHQRKDGTSFDASISMAARFDGSGTLLGFSKVLRDISAQKIVDNALRASLTEKEVLLREIHHRVKNNLQIISSLLTLQVTHETSADARRGLVESQNRIRSMAMVHQLLYQSHDLARIDLAEYIRGLTSRVKSAYGDEPSQIRLAVRAPRMPIDIDRAIPCGLIVNELVTNALIHAFPDGRRGVIDVDVERHGQQIVLEVRDDGVGMPHDPEANSHSFGLQIAKLLAHQLGGQIVFESRCASTEQPAHGTTIRLSFPELSGAGSGEQILDDTDKPPAAERFA